MKRFTSFDQPTLQFLTQISYGLEYDHPTDLYESGYNNALRDFREQLEQLNTKQESLQNAEVC